MKNYYYDYDSVVMETPEEREAKKKSQRRLFSRVFLALFIYTIIAQFSAVGVYLIAEMLLSPELYAAFAESSIWEVIISCGVQYLIAFPIFMLLLIGVKKSQTSEKTRLSFKDFVMLFVIGQLLMTIGSLIGNILR